MDNLVSAERLAEVGLPYINDFAVGVFDSRERAQKRCPAGWEVFVELAGRTLLNAIRIGQVRVRQGDPAYPLYAVLRSKGEHHEENSLP